MKNEASLDLAERLFAAIVAGDVDAVRGIYSPDARVWHNFDQVEQTVDENLRVLRWLVRSVAGLRYEEIRRQATDSGFVQQHVLRGTSPTGKPIELPACMVCTVKDGRITRIEEYFDSAQLAPLATDPSTPLGKGD
jgi:ketosteroid isomerase-like protein